MLVFHEVIKEMRPFSDTKKVMVVICVFIMLTGMISGAILISNVSDSAHMAIKSPILAGPSRPATLGFDCGVGTKQAVLNGTSFPVAPSEFGPPFQTLSNCFWIGDVGQSGAGSPNGTSDGTIEPLVSEQDEVLNTISPKIGGGFTADINLVQNGSITSTVDGFDLTVSWNPSLLQAVTVDQGGLLWNSLAPLSLASKIDNTAGTVRLAQIVTGSPLGLNLTLFRIRFDVVGVGITSLTVGTTPGSPCGICNPSPVVFQSKSLNFDSESFYDPNHTLNWSASWAFSPNPLVPGSPVTFTATASCTGCTGALSYRWDVNNDTVTDATTNPATLTLPNPGLTGTTVKLKILDAGISVLNHNVTLVQTLPLTARVSPASTSLSLTQGGAWNATWVGGLPKYTETWRFCPGATTANAICVKPTVTNAATSAQTILQTLNPINATAGAFHFAGAYNDSVTITDAGSPSLPGPNKSTLIFLVNVTGAPLAFTPVVTTTSLQNATVNVPVTFKVTVAYHSAYPTAFRSNLFNYRFMFGDGSVATLTNVFGLSATFTHTYLSVGNYNIEVASTEAANFAPSKIQENGFFALSVATPVTGDFSISPTPPLSGQSSSFTTAISGGVSPYVFAWTFGDGKSGTGATPTHTFASSGSYTVSLTVTDAGGRFLSKSHAIDISPGPVSGSFTFATNQTSSLSIIFNGTAIGGTAPYTYAWNFGDGTTGSGANPSHAYTKGGNYTVTVTITDAGSRTATVTQSVVISVPPSTEIPYLLYASIAGVAIVVAGVGVYFLRKRRKPQLPQK